MGRILVAGLTIGICVYLYTMAGDYPRAARRLPQLLAICVVLLALAGILETVLTIVAGRWQAAEAPTFFTAPHRQDLAIGIAFVALVAAYIWAIPKFGYLLATPLMLFLPLAILRPVGWLGIGTTLVAVTGVIFVVFIWFLNLPIPLYPGG